MSTSPDHFTEKEIHELSAQLKISLSPLTFDRPFVEYKKRQSKQATRWTISGIAAAIIAILTYSIVDQLSIAPAWSASPLKVSTTNEAAILTTCSLLLPEELQSKQVASSDRPKIHLVDFRSDYGDAVLITGGMNPQIMRTWTCHFVKPKNSEFKAIDLNEAHFSYSYVSGNLNEGISASVVWRGGSSFDGVKIPSSQIISGPLIHGAVSVKVKCPNLPSAEAAISKTSSIFSIWIPSTSQKCLVTYIDKKGHTV